MDSFAHLAQGFAVAAKPVNLLVALLGLLWPWITKLGLGRLPGDLRIDKPGFTLFAPFTTMLIVSVVLSLVIWLLRR